MKVKELIEHLSKLDQERNIWLIYDTYFLYEPAVDGTMSKKETKWWHDNDEPDVEMGDYYMEVG